MRFTSDMEPYRPLSAAADPYVTDVPMRIRRSVQGVLMTGHVFLLALTMTTGSLIDFLTMIERVRRLLPVFLAGVLLHITLFLGAFAAQRGDPTALPPVNCVRTRLPGRLLAPNPFGGMTACIRMLNLLTAGTPLAVMRPRARWMATALLSCGLILMFSRSAWIATMFGIAVTVLSAGWRAARTGPPIAGVAVTVPVLAVLLVPSRDRLASRPKQINDRGALATFRHPDR